MPTPAHVNGATAKNIQGAVREVTAPGSSLMTDQAVAYQALGKDCVHHFVNHRVECVRQHSYEWH